MPESLPRVRRGLVEFVLIAVGVFVGLAADEWRKTRSEIRQEQDYVRRLMLDLEDDISAHEAVERNLEQSIPVLLRLASTERLDDPELVAQAAADLSDVRRGFLWAAFPVRRGTYDELLSTGRMSLIRDPELRESIMQYYGMGNALTSALMRRREFTGLGPIATNYVLDAEFDSLEGGRPLQSHELVGQLDVTELRKAATAELNYRALRQKWMADQEERRQDLLKRLLQAQASR